MSPLDATSKLSIDAFAFDTIVVKAPAETSIESTEALRTPKAVLVLPSNVSKSAIAVALVAIAESASLSF